MPKDLAKKLKEKTHAKEDKLEGARDAAQDLTDHIVVILEFAKTEGLDDSQIGEIIRQVITELKSIRQNVLRFRKIERLDS